MCLHCKCQHLLMLDKVGADVNAVVRKLLLLLALIAAHTFRVHLFALMMKSSLQHA